MKNDRNTIFFVIFNVLKSLLNLKYQIFSNESFKTMFSDNENCVPYQQVSIKNVTPNYVICFGFDSQFNFNSIFAGHQHSGIQGTPQHDCDTAGHD